MNERIKAARKALKLSQEEFGRRIGLSKFAISNYENGKQPITERSFSDICREFNICEEWLRTGAGEMFLYTEESAIAQLAQEHGLDEFAVRALTAYQKLTPANRAVIKQYILSIAAGYGVELDELREEAEIDAKAEAYKEELRQEKSIETSSASPKQKDA